MIIANPIYDVVFKYLLDDLEIARGLLSAILEEDIIELQTKPQETATEIVEKNINIMRVDFKAIIKTANGEEKKILIELQKVKQLFDVMRFRRYLGDNYRKDDEILTKDGTVEKRALPIVTIYFLGFNLDNIHIPVVHINRQYQNVVTKEILDVKEDFVELLTHDSFIIQIKLLMSEAKTQLERVLDVFSPKFKTKDRHQLDFEGDLELPLVKRMVQRLGRAIADNEVRHQMEIEDEVEGIFAKQDETIKYQTEQLQLKTEQLATKDQELATKEKELEAEREKAVEKERQFQELLKELERLKNNPNQ